METRTRTQLEKIINTVLWIVLIVFIGMATQHWYENNYVPVEFQQPESHAAPLFKVKDRTDQEDTTWVREHFAAPVAEQGEPPEDWTEVEASLDPATCGICHPQQLTDWSQSWHANGMGPGVMGQLVDDDKLVKPCQSCHAPNSEQYPVLDGEENPHFDAALQTKGLTCAGCHVREWERLGPDGHPAMTDLEEGSTEEPTANPHGGATAVPEFRQSVFCESCHDFREGQLALEDKLLQETYQEWRRTSFAEEGVTCQGCHMPEGRHLWKGIHDKEMTRAAFTATAKLNRGGEGFLEPLEAEVTITNTGAGHRFPTYTTPSVVIVFEQLDQSGTPIDGTRQEGHVSRRVTPDLQKELWDTRLLPGEEFTMVYRAELREEARGLDARVEVWPDDGYTRFYEIKLKKPENHPEGAAQLEEALRLSKESRYIAWQSEVPVNQE